MRFRFGFVLGAAAGFFAGATIGQEALEVASDFLSGLRRSTKPAPRLVTVRGAQAAGDSSNTRSAPVSGPVAADMDPSDLQFGRASMQKEELVDQAIADGTVDQLIDEGADPRAGNKADLPRG